MILLHAEHLRVFFDRAKSASDLNSNNTSALSALQPFDRYSLHIQTSSITVKNNMSHANKTNVLTLSSTAKIEQGPAHRGWGVGPDGEEYSNIETISQVTAAEEHESQRNYRNPKGNAEIQCCLDNKDAILALHSSVVETKDFQL